MGGARSFGYAIFAAPKRAPRGDPISERKRKPPASHFSREKCSKMYFVAASLADEIGRIISFGLPPEVVRYSRSVRIFSVPSLLGTPCALGAESRERFHGTYSRG